MVSSAKRNYSNILKYFNSYPYLLRQARPATSRGARPHPKDEARGAAQTPEKDPEEVDPPDREAAAETG